MENIMVVFGGQSVEHDISIITGVQIANACAGLNYNILSVYIDKLNNWHLCNNTPKIEDFKSALDKTKFQDVIWKVGDNKLYYINKLGRLKSFCEIDFALLCCHGKSGEDGTLPALFELSNLPYTSSNFYSCAVAMDKCIMKDVFFANNITSLPYYKLNKNDYLKNKDAFIKEIFTKFNTHNLIIKPACLGSSIGIGVANSPNTLKEKIEIAFAYDNKLLIEPKLTNFIEVNCSVRQKNNDIQSSICEYPKINSSILSFEDKYLSGDKFKNANNNSYNAKNESITFNNSNIPIENNKEDNISHQTPTLKQNNEESNEIFANNEIFPNSIEEDKSKDINILGKNTLINTTTHFANSLSDKKITSSNKFNNSDTKKLLDDNIENEIQEISKKIYKICDASGVVRIDFLYDNENKIIYANEINTIPGSLSINLWLKSGVSNSELIKDLISSGKEKYNQNKKLTSAFSSSVLDYY